MNDDREHLSVLSLLHFVMAGFLAFGLCIAGVWGAFVTGLVKHGLHEAAARGENLPPRGLFTLLGLLMFGIGALWLAMLFAVVVSGIGLATRRFRLFSMVVAALLCTSFPFGTLLGVFTLLVLTRGSVRELYAGTTSARSA